MATLKDVAEAAGYGLGTVSRALSGHPSVRPETRRRVQEVAKRIGYQQNALARALRESQSRSIGLVIPDLENEFYNAGATVLQDVFADEGYRLMLCCSGNDPEADAELLRSLVEHRVDGIAHVPCSAAGSAVVREANPRLPVVEYARRSSDDQVDSITGDEEAGAAALVAHLVSLGHRRIAMIAGPEHLSTTRARSTGFVRGVRDTGLSERECPVLYGEYTVAWGATAMARILEVHPDVTAVFASSSRGVLGLLRTLAAHGKRAPEDVSVVGFLNPEWFEVAAPPITTYELPLRDMGAMAAQLLFSRIRANLAETTPPEARRIRCEGRIVHRASTAPPTR